MPHAVITFIGPINANFETSFGTQGDILTPEALGVGLQLHLGKNFSLYKSQARAGAISCNTLQTILMRAHSGKLYAKYY